MITKIWRSDDGTTVVWEINPGMLFSYEAVTGCLMPLSEYFRRECLESSTGGYTQVWEG